MTKQYLMMVDDAGLAAFQRVLGHIQFLEIQGMSVGESNQYKVLVTPVVPPLPDVKPLEVQEPA